MPNPQATVNTTIQQRINTLTSDSLDINTQNKTGSMKLSRMVVMTELMKIPAGNMLYTVDKPIEIKEKHVYCQKGYSDILFL